MNQAEKAEIISRIERGASVRTVAVGLNLPLSATYYHARALCKHQTRFDLRSLDSKERGYLLGMYVGDGSLIRHEARGEFLLKIALDKLRDRDILRFLCSILERAGKKTNVMEYRGMFILRVWSKPLYAFIRSHVRLCRRSSVGHFTKILVNHEIWGREFAVGFLGGLIDSDGHIAGNHRGGHYGAIIVTSSVSLKNQLSEICHELGIAASIRIDSRGAPSVRPRYAVYLMSKSLNSLCSEIISVKHQRFHGGPGRN